MPGLTPEDEAREVPVVARRGDVIAHHCLVIHGADVNASDGQHRRSIGYRRARSPHHAPASLVGPVPAFVLTKSEVGSWHQLW
jgi:ectoine hydroxylase-related dioxygenase (phytanoyl-CoA dioxygenase family)